MTVPVLVAHRGYASRFPENTLESIEAALTAGACFVEFDVQLTSDGVPVLFHDANLRRVAGRSGRVLQISYSQLSEIEVNQPQVFGDCFRDARAPTLAGAMALLKRWPRAQAFVEIKPEGIEHFSIEKVLERISVDLAATPSQYILISSVGDFVLRARQSGHPKIGLVLEEWSGAARRRLEELRPDYVFCNLKRIAPKVRLWRGPWKWVIYEVVDPTLALELARRGADLIETMAIGEMLADPRLIARSCRE